MVSSDSRFEPTESSDRSVSSAPLSDEDVRAIVRLLGQTVVAPGDLRAKRRFLVAELAKLVDANVWLWFYGNIPNTSHFQPAQILDGGWISDEQRVGGIQSMEAPETAELQQFFPHFLSKQITFCRASVMSQEQWRATPFFQKHRAPLGLDEFIFSTYPLNESGAFSGIGLHRFLGKPPFTSRDTKIVHLVLSEIDWLHRDGVDVEAVGSVANLSRRQRQVLLLLLSGDAVKQIATKLQISDHTVRDHVKVLHEHFGVSTRGELLAKFLSGAADVR